VDFPGAVHHVYARGIEKREIYTDDRDRMDFLERVGSNLDRWGLRCFAWALMPNHFHLLLRSDKGRLSSFMQCLMTGYSMYFNERHRRVGHLFQNRFKSPVVAKSAYFRDVVRYIHLNPLRSGIVRSMDALETYFWTGHRRIVRGGFPDWQDLGVLQLEFGNGGDGRGWISSYLEFLGAHLDRAAITEREENDRMFPDTDIRAIPGSSDSYKTFSAILHAISANRGVPVEEVLGGSRRFDAVDVRREVTKTCRERMTVTLALLARWLGVSEKSATYLLKSKTRERR
jgi:REP element-mobilizing transposase RayT